MEPGSWEPQRTCLHQPNGPWVDGNWELSSQPVVAFHSRQPGEPDRIHKVHSAATTGPIRTGSAGPDVVHLPILAIPTTTSKPTVSPFPPGREIRPRGRQTVTSFLRVHSPIQDLQSRPFIRNAS